MALGQTYQGRDDNIYCPTVQSYKFNNPDSTVDQTCISFSFWKNSLIINIAPKRQVGFSDGIPSFDMQGGIKAFLNHSKAKLLAQAFRDFISDPVKYNNVGVVTNSNIIVVSDGSAYGSVNPVIRIHKTDNMHNSIGTYAYECKPANILVGYDKENAEMRYYDSPNQELLEIIELLEEYAKACTNAYTFSNMYVGLFDQMNDRLGLHMIADKLGVKIPDPDPKKGPNNYDGGTGSYRSQSYFNQPPASPPQPTSQQQPYSSMNDTLYPASIDDIL